MTIFAVRFVIVVAVSCQAKSQVQCRFQPFLGPEVNYDFYGCSYEVDWSRVFPKPCKSVIARYEVQFIFGCTNNNLRSQYVTKERLSLPELEEVVLQQCFTENATCHARVRAQMNDMSWSEYSAWSNLSISDTHYQETADQACIIKGTDLCLPIYAQCGGGMFPEFIINEELYLLQDLLSNFNTTYNQLRQGYDICFERVAKNMIFVEFCPSNPVCTTFAPSNDGEFTISKRTTIQIRAGHCSTCNNMNYVQSQNLSIVSGTHVQGNQCVVVNLTGPNIDNEISSPSRDSVCVLIVSPRYILPSTTIHLRLSGINGITSDIGSSILLNASQQSYCEKITVSNQSRSLEIILTGADARSTIYLPRPCISTIHNNTMDRILAEMLTTPDIDGTSSESANEAVRKKSTFMMIIMAIIIVYLILDTLLS